MIKFYDIAIFEYLHIKYNIKIRLVLYMVFSYLFI